MVRFHRKRKNLPDAVVTVGSGLELQRPLEFHGAGRPSHISSIARPTARSCASTKRLQHTGRPDARRVHTLRKNLYCSEGRTKRGEKDTTDLRGFPRWTATILARRSYGCGGSPKNRDARLRADLHRAYQTPEPPDEDTIKDASRKLRILFAHHLRHHIRLAASEAGITALHGRDRVGADI